MRPLTQILLAALIISKILLGSVFLYRVEMDSSFMKTDAIAAEPQKDPEKRAEEHANTAEEETINLEFLIKKKAHLQKQEAEIAKKRAELMAIQEDINNKIAILTQLRDEIRAEMDKKKAMEDQKLKHLIKAYSAMKPQKAASLVEKLDTKFAIELLSKMKGDVVGSILSYVEVEKAAKISEQLLKGTRG